jgi:transposase
MLSVSLWTSTASRSSIPGSSTARSRSRWDRPALPRATTAGPSMSPVTSAASVASAIERAAIRQCCCGTSAGSGAATVTAPAESATLRSRGRRSLTNRFRKYLFERAVREPIAQVATAEKVSFYRVVEAFDTHACDELAESPQCFPRVVNLDESAFRRMFRYHTVFSDPERGVVFELVEDRSQAAAELGFSLMSPDMRAGIESVAIDCFPPYRRAAEKWVPGARVVLDKFHALRMIDHCAHRVRTRVSRKRATNLPNNRSGGQFDRRVRRLRWVFSKRAHSLGDDERTKLFATFELYPEIGLAWLLKEEFACIYEAHDRDEARRRLETWRDHVMVSGIGEFVHTWQRTLGAWQEQILNYFDDRVTNAFAEGITNKVKVIKRGAYGFRNPMRYRSKVLLACGH